MTAAVLVVAAAVVVVLVVVLVAWPTGDPRFVVGFGSSAELAVVVAVALVPIELGLWLSEYLGSQLDLVSLRLLLPSCCYR